jgi:hypothetical protein
VVPAARSCEPPEWFRFDVEPAGRTRTRFATFPKVCGALLVDGHHDPYAGPVNPAVDIGAVLVVDDEPMACRRSAMPVTSP